MGEAKRRHIMASPESPSAGTLVGADSMAIVNLLLPQLERLAQKRGWPAVLNGLSTLHVNLHIEQRGVVATERVLRKMLAAVPRAAAAMREFDKDGMAMPPASRA